MSLIFNIGLFFIGFLPAMSIITMVLSATFGDSAVSSTGWDIGWNPILAFIVNAPWQVPALVAVPLLHFLGKFLAQKYSRPRARVFLLGLAPTFFLLVNLGIWGPSNFKWELILPVAGAGVLYGALQRIPGPRCNTAGGAPGSASVLS